MIKKLYITLLLVSLTIISSCKTNLNNNVQKWTGKYYVESYNKDNLITSFDITIFNLDSISLVYISDENPPEIYHNLIATNSLPNKIMIMFNSKHEDMGVIYLEEINNKYYISGDPIYFINPGNKTLEIIRKENYN